ncbi:MAG TPA: MFS transporter, partial [Chloroflexota bacterium]|nr:MFS transporter [Chloroflexota bacterium]
MTESSSGAQLTIARRVAYLGGSFSVGVYSAFNNYTMSLWLTSFTTSYVIISLLGNSKSVEGSIVSPLFGAWSDRIWLGWLGRRRPFILVGGVLSGLLMAITPWVARWPAPHGLGLPPDVQQILPIIVVVFLFTLTFNMGDDLHKALRADLTDDAELNLMSSLATIVDIASQVGILALGFWLWNDSVPDWAFLLAGGLVAAGALATTIGITEPEPIVWAERMAGAEHEALSALDILRRYRGALVFCAVTLAYWSGVNAVLPLLSIFVRDILRTSAGEAQLLPGLLLLSSTLMAIPVGWLGTLVGKRRVL